MPLFLPREGVWPLGERVMWTRERDTIKKQEEERVERVERKGREMIEIEIEIER